MSELEPSQLRVSDADRHRVAELLREAAGEGRLQLDELDERLEQAYAARTYADLVPVTADLPTRLTGPPARTNEVAPRGATTSFDRSLAILGGTTRRGVWQIGATHTAVAVMGGVEIDLTDVVFSAPVTEIRAYAFWGGIDIRVGAHTRIEVDGAGIMGGFAQSSDEVDAELDDSSPVLRVTGFALMGGVNVARREPRD
jgi:hypothetical protein